MKFKKILPPPQSKESEDDPNYSLKKYSKQLLKRTITSDEFREVLKSQTDYKYNVLRCIVNYSTYPNT